MDELIQWPVFQCLGGKLMNTVKLAHVYDGGDAALYTDFNDDVFLCRIVSREKGEFSQKKLDELCGKGVIAFETGKPCLALSADGHVYAVAEALPDLTALEKVKIVEVACGKAHAVALTDTGKVYTWGSNYYEQCGVETDDEEVVNCLQTDVSFSSVRASGDISAFLTTSGQIFICGKWSERNTFIRFTNPFSTPNKQRYEQMYLGTNFGVALRDDGEVVVWTGKEIAQKKPLFVNPTYVSFVEIAVHKSGQCVAAMSTDGKVCVMQCDVSRDGFFQEPSFVPTCHPSLCSALSSQKNRFGSHNTILVRKNEPSVRKSFNDPAESDCTFLVEGKNIYAHKSILKIQNEYFRRMFNGTWKESNKPIEICSYSYHAYYVMLRYFYTDQLDTDSVHTDCDTDIVHTDYNHTDCLIDVLQLAHETLNEKLIDECVTQLVKQINFENIMRVQALAEVLDTDKLQVYCKRFARAHLLAILKTETYAELPPTSAHDFTLSVTGNKHDNSSHPKTNCEKRKIDEITENESECKKLAI